MNTTAKPEINETQKLLRQTAVGTSVTVVLVASLISLANFIV